MEPMKKWIAHSPVYNQEHFISQWVQNASAYADVVLALFSELPWTYNPKARKNFKPDSTGKILSELKNRYPKLMVIKDVWEDETAERNRAILEARNLGGRYLLIVDADEFFLADDIKKAMAFIEQNPADCWEIPHIQLIKQDNWRVETEDDPQYVEFAIDLERVKKFKAKRKPEAKKIVRIPPEVCKCYHYSYLMPYEKLVEKLNSFGHAHQIRRNWFKKVWPKIKPGASSFHPVYPDAWKGVIEVDTPKEIKDLFKDEKWFKEFSMEKAHSVNTGMTIPDKIKALATVASPSNFTRYKNEFKEAITSAFYRSMFRTKYDRKFYRAVSQSRTAGNFGKWALAKNSMNALVTALGDKSNLRIAEFGSGISTIFLDRYYGSQVTLDSYEHQEEFAVDLQKQIRSDKIEVHRRDLWQFADEEYESIFNQKVAFESLYKTGHPLDRELYSRTRVKNCFYQIDSIGTDYDAVILDGPHGNGRSIAFAVLSGRLKNPAYILIDDCNHYDFLYRCASYFHFNILSAEIYPSKRWILLEVTQPDKPQTSR